MDYDDDDDDGFVISSSTFRQIVDKPQNTEIFAGVLLSYIE